MPNAMFRELFKRHPHNPLLTVDDWPYPCNSVFNAGATKFEDDYLILVRVEDHRGFSHLTAARSHDGITDWKIDSQPTMLPEPEEHPEEIWGIEDPRITESRVRISGRLPTLRSLVAGLLFHLRRQGISKRSTGLVR